jgi:hypothetical protein
MFCAIASYGIRSTLWSDLGYWLNGLTASRYLKCEEKDVFLTFIDHYNYTGVRALLKKFDVYEQQMAAGMKPRPSLKV